MQLLCYRLTLVVSQPHFVTSCATRTKHKRFLHEHLIQYVIHNQLSVITFETTLLNSVIKQKYNKIQLSLSVQIHFSFLSFKKYLLFGPQQTADIIYICKTRQD
jgi:hypothetical protein